MSSLAHQVRTNLLTTTDHAADTVAKGPLWGSSAGFLMQRPGLVPVFSAAGGEAKESPDSLSRGCETGTEALANVLFLPGQLSWPLPPTRGHG